MLFLCVLIFDRKKAYSSQSNLKESASFNKPNKNNEKTREQFVLSLAEQLK